MPLHLLSTSLNLGPRPGGHYELVDLSTGSVSFTPTNPGGTPLPQLFTIGDHPPFPARGLEALRLLRDSRTHLLIGRKKPSARKESHDPTGSTPRKPRAKKLSIATASLLSTLDPAVAACLRGIL